MCALLERDLSQFNNSDLANSFSELLVKIASNEELNNSRIDRPFALALPFFRN